jgi:hypothetical protein
MHVKRALPDHGHGVIHSIRHFKRASDKKSMPKVEISSGVGQTSRMWTGLAVQAGHILARDQH